MKVRKVEIFTQLFVKLIGDSSFETATNDDKKLIVKKYTHDFLIGTIDDFFGNRSYSVSQSTKTKDAKKPRKN